MNARTWMLGMMAAVALVAQPAWATKITYSGTGKVERVGGALAPTGNAPIGTPVAFSFGFDTQDATLFEQDDDFAAYYDLPVSDFAATIGGFAFDLNTDPVFVPTVEIYRAFKFFPGNTSSTRVLVVNFYFSGKPLEGASSAGPFPLPAGTRDSFFLSATFRTNDTDTSLGIDQIIDPATAVERGFSYGATDAIKKQRGQLSGSFAGGFATAAVPEPATWALMLLGFGAVGAALRRDRRRVSGAAVPA